MGHFEDPGKHIFQVFFGTSYQLISSCQAGHLQTTHFLYTWETKEIHVDAVCAFIC